MAKPYLNIPGCFTDALHPVFTALAATNSPGTLAMGTGRLATAPEPLVQAGAVEALAACLTGQAWQLARGRVEDGVADEALLLACIIVVEAEQRSHRFAKLAHARPQQSWVQLHRWCGQQAHIPPAIHCCPPHPLKITTGNPLPTFELALQVLLPQCHGLRHRPALRAEEGRDGEEPLAQTRLAHAHLGGVAKFLVSPHT